MRFYEELFGMERLPTPNFGLKIRWLGLGDQQLHLFDVDEVPPCPATTTSGSTSTTSRAST